MFGYIYLTENLINGRCYIGKHKPHKKDKVDLWYKGSGAVLKQAYEKYGKYNFVTTLIEWCNTEEELNEREQYWIKKCDANNNPGFYNIAPGGNGGAVRGFGWQQTEYQKKRMSDIFTGKPKSAEHRKKLSEANKHPYYEGRPTNKGRHWYTNGIKSYLTFECPEGYWPGRVYG